MLQTYNDEGIISTYTYGLQRIKSKGQINEIYLYDGRCSVTGSVNANNEFVSYSYTAYGELMPNSPTPKVYGYNAEATDYKIGLQYLRVRYYSTDIQRFVHEDDYKGKFNNPASMNRYVYAYSNPIANTDPSGYSPPSNISKMLKQREKNQEYKDRYSKPVSATPFPTQAEVKGQWYKDYYTRGNNKATPFPTEAELKGQWYKDHYTSGNNNAIQIINENGDVLVANPYPYGPSLITKDVYNCLKDIDEGKALEVNLYPVIDELDIIYEALADIASQSRGSLSHANTILMGNVAELMNQDSSTNFYSQKEDAIIEFADIAIPLTDDTNREHAAVMYGINGVYFNSEIVEGEHNNVVKFAVKNSYHPEGREEYLLHTHPNDGNGNPYTGTSDNGPFSGIPGAIINVDIVNTLDTTQSPYGSLKSPDFFAFGDTDVVDVLGYDGIYLTASTGDVFLYEGYGGYDSITNPTQAKNEYELERMEPIYKQLTKKSQYKYTGVNEYTVDNPKVRQSWP